MLIYTNFHTFWAGSRRQQKSNEIGIVPTFKLLKLTPEKTDVKKEICILVTEIKFLVVQNRLLVFVRVTECSNFLNKLNFLLYNGLKYLLDWDNSSKPHFCDAIIIQTQICCRIKWTRMVFRCIKVCSATISSSCWCKLPVF